MDHQATSYGADALRDLTNEIAPHPLPRTTTRLRPLARAEGGRVVSGSAIAARVGATIAVFDDDFARDARVDFDRSDGDRARSAEDAAPMAA